jgi:polyphosphate glucokinase
MEQKDVMQALGIDIGGSGIKGALVDIGTGELASERFRLPTPPQALPADVAQVVADIVQHFGWQGAVGCTFPAIIKRGVAHTAANIDPSWVGVNVQALLTQQAGVPVVVLNDADAAGIAEMRLGAGKNQSGVVIVFTLGTGIGSALFVDGVLVPNTELGHLEIRGKVAEHRSSDRTRKEKDLDWEEWAERLNDYLAHVERLFSPDLFILSGGVSKKHAKYLHLLTTQAQLVPAHLLNNAGIVGAAMAAKEQQR